ncbi:MAG: hypothetical protein J6R01_08295, partial [Alistipes sp.]|nr:hypothetical protein [Alistipes sp.]
MLTPEYLQRISDGAEDGAAELHAEIISRIIARLIQRFEDTGEIIMTGTDKFQIEVLRDAGALLNEIQDDIAIAAGFELAEIQAAFEDAGVESFNYDTRMYQQAGIIEPDIEVTLANGSAITQPPVVLTQHPAYVRLIQRNYEATAGTWRNCTRSFAGAAYDKFITECDRAYMLTATGAVSRSQAVREAVGRIAKSGVTIQYEDAEGHVTRRDSIETATARAVRTGVGQACADITDVRMEEMEWDIILTSAHIGARIGDGGQNYTNHAWWQGRFFSRSGKDTKHPPFAVCGRGKAQGICGINCRHSYGPGDGKNNPFDKIDSKENKRVYLATQRQRRLESRVRNTKNRLAGLKTALETTQDNETRSGLQDDFDRVSALLEKQNAAYEDFCK